jgi:cyclic-di-GMP-binding biofilm dispersal mediator protein
LTRSEQSSLEANPHDLDLSPDADPHSAPDHLARSRPVSATGGTPLTGASVLLAGASGGLGSALAAALDQRGAIVTAVGRDANRLNALPARGGRLVADLSDSDACEEAVDLASEPTGSLDVLINAVGVVAFGPATDLSPVVLRELLEINVLIPMLLARAALPQMSRGGTLANISGLVAEPGKAMAHMAAYVASKAAVRGFDEALSREARRVGVRVLDVRPPHTETGLATRALAGRAPALPRGLDPADVAETICDAIEAGARDLPSEAFAR